MADSKDTIPNPRIKFWKTEIPTSEHWAIKTLVLLLATLVKLAQAAASALAAFAPFRLLQR
jgi:hypothetical protein